LRGGEKERKKGEEGLDGRSEKEWQGGKGGRDSAVGLYCEGKEPE